MRSLEDLIMTSPTKSGSPESPTIARKRKNSTNEAGIGRAVKHRSSQACQSCRIRKVRCDVLANGSHCTNCRLDRMECIVVASRRGKTNHTYRNSTTQIMHSPPSQSGKVRSDSGPNLTKNDSWTGYEEIYTPITPSSANHVPVCVTFEEDLDKARSNQQPAANNTTRNGANHTPSEAYDRLLTPEPGTNTLNQYQSPTGKAPLPAFITPLSSRILSEDIEFLAQKGAITVPEPDLRVEILRGYLFSVHPFMPMLNFRAFIHAVLNNREDGRISLLLFQAVMFAGLHSLQLHLIHRLGFKTVKQARSVFFDRVRLLYEFNVETDSTAVLQSLVLMSLWYGKWDDRRHTWHWTGLAYDVARSMGLHREPTTRYASEKVRRFRRRLWWSLYIRDRMIALGTRRPMRIRDDDFDVAMLTLEDFDIEPLEESFQGQPLIPSAEESTSTALMCIQLAMLCTCIGHVVSSQYTVLNTQSDVPHTMMVVPRRKGGHNQELESCDRELNKWFQELGTNVRRTESPTTQDGPHSCSEIHWAILNITYLTVVNVLHRAQTLHSLPDAAEAQIVQRSSKSKVKDAARSLTKFSQTMLHHDQVRFLGPIGVTALVAACLSHMLDINSGDEDVRDASTFRLCQSLQVLQSLRGIYASADASVSFLASVTRKAGIPVPAQFAAPVADFVSASAEGLVRSSTSRQQSTAWKESTGSPGERWGFSNEQPNALNAGWQANPLQVLTQSANNYLPPQTLPHRDGQVLTTSGVMQPTARVGTVGHSAVAFATSKHTGVSGQGTDMTNNTPTTEHCIVQAINATFGGLSNSAADGAFFDWSNGMDAGMDLESMALNYDLYSDAFGFSDGHLQGI